MSACAPCPSSSHLRPHSPRTVTLCASELSSECVLPNPRSSYTISLGIWSPFVGAKERDSCSLRSPGVRISAASSHVAEAPSFIYKLHLHQSASVCHLESLRHKAELPVVVTEHGGHSGCKDCSDLQRVVPMQPHWCCLQGDQPPSAIKYADHSNIISVLRRAGLLFFVRKPSPRKHLCPTMLSYVQKPDRTNYQDLWVKGDSDGDGGEGYEFGALGQ
eukprot:5092637-Pleurochrysis_carterae.AAC.1